ncbi:hypothetical protein OKW43_007841 [Paraburkholderia sp. WC7.3g]
MRLADARRLRSAAPAAKRSAEPEPLIEAKPNRRPGCLMEASMYCDIQVTVDSDPHNDRSESWLAVNPLNPYNMVGSSKRFVNPATYDFSLSAYATFDGGYTWTEALPLGLLSDPDPNKVWAGVSDPAVAWDNLGNCYIVALPFPSPSSPYETLGIAVYRSTDGGRTWSAPNYIHPNPGDDKQSAAGDGTPGSPHFGNVYAAWDNGSRLAFARTTDHGATWTGVGAHPVGAGLDTVVTDSFSPEVTVARDGTVYIVWVAGEEFGNTIKFVMSTDGGQSFSAPQVVASGITQLKSPPLPAPDGFPELPGGTFRVLTIASACCGAGSNLVVAWADYRDGVSRVYYRNSGDGGAIWQGPASGQPLLPAWLASGTDQHDFHPQLASRPNGEIACAFYEFGPKGGARLIDVILATSTDNGASFTSRDTVTDRPWDPTVDAPLSHGAPGTTFIGDYFGLAGSTLGFFPFWTDTRTGIQEIFTAKPMQLGPWVGTQFTGTVAAGQTHRWYTFNWPACWHVVWTVVPTTPHPGAPQITWQVQVERASANEITYWISITNLTAAPVNIEARYVVLAAD